MKTTSFGELFKQIFQALLVGLALIIINKAAAAYANQQQNKNGSLDRAAKLDSAKSAYESADFEKAIRILNPIVGGKSDSSFVRRTGLWYLGKCFVAKKALASARWAVSELIRIDPDFEPEFDKESPPLLRVYYEAKKEKTGSYAVEVSDPGVQTMTIVEFKNRSFIKNRELYNPMEKGFADIMMFAMLGTTQLKVVERDRVQWLIKEQGIQKHHEMEGAVRAGKLLAAHVVLMGSFILQKNEDIFLNARLVKVETGEVLLHEAEEGDFEDFPKITRKLAKKITKAIKINEIYVPRAEVPNSLDAMLAYSEGLVFLDKDMYDEAFKKFELALQYDPEFERAKKAMERIRPLTAYYAQAVQAEKR